MTDQPWIEPPPAGSTPDRRCCGDHPGEWDTDAEPGQSFCRACLDRLDAEGRAAWKHSENDRLRLALAAASNHFCAYCGARPGEWCVRSSGYLTVVPHSPRRKLAERARRLSP